MVRHLAADLRWPGGPDRGDAAHPGRGEALDRPAAVPVRPLLLHAAARVRRPSSWRRTSAGCSTASGARSIAGILFVLPGVVALLALSAVYVAYGDTTFVEAVFLGLAPAVIAIVIQAVVRVGQKGLTHPALVGLAVASFVALTFFAVPFPAVVAVAALVGWLLGRFIPGPDPAPKPAVDDGPAPLISDEALHTERPTGRRSAAILDGGAVRVVAPGRAARGAFGRDSIFVDQGLFFSGAAVVTFGGAYAVLAYVAQQAVNVYGWLAPGEMVRGLALAETTPGPLIMVVQFVAFVGAYRDPGSLNPWAAAVIAALLTTWVTFVPCFLFILLGAPYVERLRGNRACRQRWPASPPRWSASSPTSPCTSPSTRCSPRPAG